MRGSVGVGVWMGVRGYVGVGVWVCGCFEVWVSGGAGEWFWYDEKDGRQSYQHKDWDVYTGVSSAVVSPDCSSPVGGKHG